MRGSRFLLVALTSCLLAVVLVSTADAQQRRPGFGGPGGRGGPGFGGGPGGGALGLLAIPQVREEIELIEDQQTQLTEFAESLRDEMRGQFEGLRDLPEGERRERFEAAQAEVTEKVRAKVEEVLLPHQIERLEQIQLQLRGAGAVAEPEVAEKLGLSEDQISEIETLRDELRAEAQQIFQRPAEGQAPDREGMAERFRQFREESQEKILAVLTTKQREQFESMQGEPLEIDRSALFGGGDGQRRGPPGQFRGRGDQDGQRRGPRERGSRERGSRDGQRGDGERGNPEA